MKKQSYNSKRNPNKSSALSERFLSRMGNYLIAIIVIMMLGLIHHDGPLRGFPVPWIFNMRHVMFRYFIPSLLITAAVVIGSDILVQIIIAVKEPKLKVHTKEPLNVASYSINTDPDVSEYSDEINEYEAEASPNTYTYGESEGKTAAGSSFDLQSLREAKEKLTDYSKKISNTKAGDDQDKKGKSASFPIIAIIGIIVAMTAPVLDILTGDDTDYYDDWDDDEIVLDADDLFSTADNAVTDQTEQMFNAMTEMDYEYFEEDFFADDAAELLDLTNWDEMSYEEIYSYMDNDENYALRKYLVTDSSEKEYIMAVYMDISNQTEGYEAYLSGIALISKKDYDQGISKLADKNKISDEEYEQYFMDKIISFGTISLDEDHILFWNDSGSLSEMEA